MLVQVQGPALQGSLALLAHLVQQLLVLLLQPLQAVLLLLQLLLSAYQLLLVGLALQPGLPQLLDLHHESEYVPIMTIQPR